MFWLRKFIDVLINGGKNCVIVVKKICYEGWMLEYKGYLMVGYFNYLVVIIYICIDEYLDII